MKVTGSLPLALSGQYLHIGETLGTPHATGGVDSTVNAVTLHEGRTVGHRSWRIRAPIRPQPSTERAVLGPRGNLVVLGGRILALHEGAVPHALAGDGRSFEPFDLAGQGRAVGPHPALDPLTGELHLVSSTPLGWTSHDVIPPSALVRRTRPLADIPIHHGAITNSRLVIFGDGFTGVIDRGGSNADRVQWFCTATAAGEEVVSAFDEGRRVVVLIAGPGLERWTLDLDDGSARREELDADPQHDGQIGGRVASSSVRYLYTLAGSSDRYRASALHKHDLAAGRRTTHHLDAGRHCDAFVFAADPTRAPAEDGGWLIGLVHDHGSGRAVLAVLDAAGLGLARLASVELPEPIADRGRGLWIPFPGS